LNPDDREDAGRQYTIIYEGLVRIFVSHGFTDAEHWADVAVDRVARKVPEIRDSYVGVKARYFVGVVRYILIEPHPKEIATEEKDFRISSQEPEPPNDYETCLLSSLAGLPLAQSDLILDYYAYGPAQKAAHRQRMARELGISENALRVRVCHIRRKLEKLIEQCLEKLDRKQKEHGDH
jgi:hypothetical protein